MLQTILTKESAEQSAQIIFGLAGSLEAEESAQESLGAFAIHGALMDAYIALKNINEDLKVDIPQDVVDRMREEQKAQVVEVETNSHLATDSVDCPSK